MAVHQLDRAVAILTERNGDALSYKVGERNTLATEWLLAAGYGTPQVYSGFTWDAPDPATLPSNA